MNFTKLIFLFSSLFFLTISKGQVTVQVSNLKVGGVSVSNNTVNFNGSSSLSLSLDVNLSTFDGSSNNTFGNVFLFFKPSGSESEIQVGFTTATFVVTYPPFVTQTTYTSSNYFSTIVLNASNFYATGGVLYAKYVNNNNSSYVSSNVSVLGGTRSSTSTQPSQSNTICCNQTIRYGDKPALINGSNFPSVYSGMIVSWIDGSGNQIANIQTIGPNMQLDYTFQTTSVKRMFRFMTTPATWSISTPVTITVVPTPIISNTIMTNGIITSNGSYEIRESSPIEFYGLSSKVNLNVLNNPFHTVDRSDPYVNVSNYQWQYKSGNASGYWTDIPNAVSSDLTGFTMPSDNSPGFYFVRRIAKYQGISLVSNVLRIVQVKISDSNTICCDQLLESASGGTFQSPVLLTGSTPVYSVTDGGVELNPSNVTFVYQWQQQSRSSSWANITGANSKDYLPPVITSFGTKINYRRVVRVKYAMSSFYDTYSNVTSVSTPQGGVRGRFNESAGSNDVIDYTIYPNPTSSILNISNIVSIESSAIKIINALGQEIKVNFVKNSENTISADVSGLQSGVYYVLFEEGLNIETRKFIKK